MAGRSSIDDSVGNRTFIRELGRNTLSFFADEGWYGVATAVSIHEDLLVDLLRRYRKRFDSSEPTGNLFRPPLVT
jgi:hypothetical protein|tara:strand:- start:1577 stop:1801 length:225 start_codon:yes stop_codon:yes gene_type:complete